MKLRTKILLATITAGIGLIILKAFLAAIPLLITGTTIFLVLTAKAYIGRKAAQKLEEHEDKIKEKIL